MKKKQWLGLIGAAVIFTVVGVVNVLTQSMANQMGGSSGGFWSSFFGGEVSESSTNADYVAVIPVNGTIQASADNQSLFSSGEYCHDAFLSEVTRLIHDERNRGILLTINSSGGTVYESDEAYLKLMEYKEKTGRPVYAYMQSYCCSGAYYIASAADYIYANRNATTGSIGVILSTYNLSGLYDKIGVQQIIISSGANKGMGSEGVAWTEEQLAIYQSVVDECYEQFIGIVAKSRGLAIEDVRKLADGRIYTASQAKELGLLHDIMGEEECRSLVANQTHAKLVFSDLNQSNLLTRLLSSSLQALGLRAAESTESKRTAMESGVPMYVCFLG